MSNIVELFEKRDVVEYCRPSLSLMNELKSLRKSVGVEIILKDGTRRYYRPRAKNKKDIQLEVFTFIKSLERATNKSVMWRYRGDNLFQMGTQTYEADKTKTSFKEKSKKFLEYFFELEN